MKTQNGLYFTYNREMAPRWHRVSLRPKCERSWSCGEISLHAPIRILRILWWRQFYRTVISYISLFTLKIIRRRARGNGRHCLIKNTDAFKKWYGTCCLLRLQGVGNPDNENRDFSLTTLFKRHWLLLIVTKEVRQWT